ncbi:MAG: hypothetical protein Q9170_001304 [Blastenia crenularia]
MPNMEKFKKMCKRIFQGRKPKSTPDSNIKDFQQRHSGSSVKKDAPKLPDFPEHTQVDVQDGVTIEDDINEALQESIGQTAKTSPHCPGTGIASSIYHQQTEDPFYVLALGTPSRPANRSNFTRPQITAVDVQGVLEHSPEEAARTVLARTFDKRSPLQNQGQIGSTENEDSGVADVDIVADAKTVRSQTPSSWERALESREQYFKNEIEDLKEDHAAEVDEMKETINQLEKLVKAAKSRKDFVEKNAKKIAGKKDAEIAQQKSLVEAADSEILSKDVALQENEQKTIRLEEQLNHANQRRLEVQYSSVQQWAISPLQKEVVRLTSLNRVAEEQIAQHSLQILILQAQNQNQPNIAELQARLSEACKERDSFEAQFEKIQQLYYQTIDEHNKARAQISNQLYRLQGYQAENDDFPAHGAQTDNLLKQKDEQYQLLEKKANDTFMLWKKGNDDHEYEKIMLNARIEQLKGRIDNLEGDVSLAQDETARLTAFAEERSVDSSDIFRALYEASQKTVAGLKEKLGNQGTQLANCERSLAQQRTEVQIRDLLLAKKDSELRTLNNEMLDVERKVENDEPGAVFQEADLKDALDTKDDELQVAKAEIQELQRTLEAIASSADSPAAAKTLANFQANVIELREHIGILENDRIQKKYERSNRDFHEATTAAQGEYSSRILQKNWELAQQEIVALKKQIECINKGCDPEKFELAQKYDELRQEKETLEQMLCAQMESMTVTLEEHTVNTKALHARVRLLSQLSERLCASLREAWAGEEQAEDYQLEIATERQITLDAIEAAIQVTIAGLPDEDFEADMNSEQAGFDIHEDAGDFSGAQGGHSEEGEISVPGAYPVSNDTSDDSQGERGPNESLEGNPEDIEPDQAVEAGFKTPISEDVSDLDASFLEYQNSIEEESKPEDDGVDPWDLILTDKPGHVDENEGPYMMTGALPANDRAEDK